MSVATRAEQFARGDIDVGVGSAKPFIDVRRGERLEQIKAVGRITPC